MRSTLRSLQESLNKTISRNAQRMDTAADYVGRFAVSLSPNFVQEFYETARRRRIEVKRMARWQ